MNIPDQLIALLMIIYVILTKHCKAKYTYDCMYNFLQLYSLSHSDKVAFISTDPVETTLDFHFSSHILDFDVSFHMRCNNSRVVLLHQIWIVNYYVKNSRNDNKKTGVSRKIVCLGILNHVLSSRQQKHQCLCFNY